MLINPSQVALLHDKGIRNDVSIDARRIDTGESSTGTWVSTGLCDLQINGFAGVDYNDPAITEEAIEASLLAMLATGVTCCLPTVITAPKAWQRDCFKALEAGRSASTLASHMIAGYHLEGPFLNPAPGYCGCHPATAMVAASWDYFQQLQDAANGMIRLITVAPEMPGVMALIPRWVDAGVTVAIGHSAADYTELCAAVDAGATLSTHLGNGMPATVAKSDNTILAQLSIDKLCASFIADDYHLQRHVLGVYLRAKQDSRTILVTDGTAASGAAAGRYTLGKVELERGAEPVVHIPGTRSLAGSATTLDVCIRHVVQWYGTPVDIATDWASDRPRELIGLPSSAVAGDTADWVWWCRKDDAVFVERVQLGETCVAAQGISIL